MRRFSHSRRAPRPTRLPSSFSISVDDLRGCDAFFSVILSATDERLYRTLGINVCCEPKYEQRRYYHK